MNFEASTQPKEVRVLLDALRWVYTQGAYAHRSNILAVVNDAISEFERLTKGDKNASMRVIPDKFTAFKREQYLEAGEYIFFTKDGQYIDETIPVLGKVVQLEGSNNLAYRKKEVQLSAYEVIDKLACELQTLTRDFQTQIVSDNKSELIDLLTKFHASCKGIER